MSDGIGQVNELQERLSAEIAPFEAIALERLSIQDAEAKLRELGDLRVKLTGKKSELSAAMKQIGSVAPEQRAEIAQTVQAISKDVTAKLDSAQSLLSGKISDLKTEAERLDVTIPGRRPRTGHLHPITLLRQRIEDIFVSMGYAI